MALAENLRYCRRQNNLSQSTVADHLGTDYNTISRYENGKSEPRIETLTRLASLYGRSIEQLRGPSLNDLHRLSLEQEREAEHEVEEATLEVPAPVQLVITLRNSPDSLERAIAQLQQVHQAVFGATSLVA